MTINLPKMEIDPVDLFGVSLSWPIHAFEERNEHVPEIDDGFCFIEEPTRAVLLGFGQNRRVYLHGPHGSGKTSHIEQVAARLNWPVLRINLDGQITRSDLVGRDMVVLRDGKQVTEYVPGMLVWALQRPMCLIFDEYDAGRPDVMFVIQRLLESNGQFTLLDHNKVIKPHPNFRIFATANTAGQGDFSGEYVGTQLINQAQMDRWQVIVGMEYPEESLELEILKREFASNSIEQLRQIVQFARLCRQAYYQGDLTILMSLRTTITWLENYALLGDLGLSLRLSFSNRCDSSEKALVSEFFQRCFAVEL